MAATAGQNLHWEYGKRLHYVTENLDEMFLGWYSSKCPFFVLI